MRVGDNLTVIQTEPGYALLVDDDGHKYGLDTDECHALNVKEALNLLDDVAASLDTCLVWYGQQMPPGDQQQRRALVQRAQQLVASFSHPLVTGEDD